TGGFSPTCGWTSEPSSTPRSCAPATRRPTPYRRTCAMRNGFAPWSARRARRGVDSGAAGSRRRPRVAGRRRTGTMPALSRRPQPLRQPREDPGTLLAARRVDLDRLRTLRERATHVVARGDLAGGDDVEAGTAFEEQLLVAPEVVARHRGAYAGCPQLGAQLA